MKDKEFTFKNVHNITAGAGAGKTTELVNIITRLVREGHPTEKMILTTFTKAAANEFRERCKAALIKEDKLEASVQMEAAMMGTVHSLAERYIRRYWYLLGMSPEVKPMETAATTILKNRAFREVVKEEDINLFHKYAATFGINDSDSYKTDDNFWHKTVEEMERYADYYGIENLTASKKYTKEFVKEVFTQKDNERLIDDFIKVADKYFTFNNIVEENATDAGRKQYKKNCDQIKVIKELRETDEGVKTTIKGLTSKKIEEIAKFRWGNDIGGLDSADRNRLKDAKAVLIEAHEELVKNLVPDEVALYPEVVKRVFDLMPECRKLYKKFKEAYGVIDFEDMERLFLQLLDYKEVQEDINASVDYLFVDEFQDSNLAQVRIFEKLSALVKKQSYFVGDRKQTIYGFRGSEAELISSIINKFPKAEKDDSSPTRYKKDENGNSSQILVTSYRSVPKLVEAANEIFVPAFNETINGYEADKIERDQVELIVHRKDNGREALYHVKLPGGYENEQRDALAAIVCQMIKDPRFKEAGYQPSDIAILTKSNSAVVSIASSLSRRNVKVDYLDKDFNNSIEVQLVLDILKLSEGIDRDLTRAEIRKMLQKETLEKLVSKIIKNENKLEELAALEQFAVGLRGLSVSERIQTIIAQLDLYDYVQRWSDGMARRSRLNILRSAATLYESMGQVFATPVDVRGYKNFLSTYKVEEKFDNSSDGVKVLTYHKSKGLDWKIVILYDLDEDGMAKSSLSGVRFAPEEENTLLVLPQLPIKDWVNYCVERVERAKKMLELQKAKDGGEEKRLLYVGFTRAKDVVITTECSPSDNEKKKGIKRKFDMLATYCPTTRGLNGEVKDGMIDIWGLTGQLSRLIEPPADPDCKTQLEAPRECVCYNGIAVLTPEHEEEKRVDFEGLSTRKYHSPSQYRDEDAEKETEVEEVMIWNKGATRIKANGLSDDELGNCIHHIYGASKLGDAEHNRKVVETTLEAYGIKLENAAEFLEQSIQRLYEYLEGVYGTAKSIDRELPFSYTDDEGHVFNGTIDMLWNTDKGIVIIDHKTFSGKTSDLLDKKSKFYAGKYASQLRLYEMALVSAGYTVIGKLLHYPIQNRMIELVSKD